MTEIQALMDAFHESCQTKHPVKDRLIDEVNVGRFPDDKDLKVCNNFIFQ